MIVLALIVGGLTQVSRQSQGYDANADRSLAAQGTVVADQSNATSVTVRRVVNNLQAQTRQGLQSTLDSAVQQTSDQSSRADLAAGATPLGPVATQFTAVFAERAESMRQLRAAVDGFLGMQPIPPADTPSDATATNPGRAPLLSAAQATNRIAAAGALLTRSDALYRSVRHSLAVDTGHGRLPPSVWVTHPQVWQLGSVAAQVDLLATSSTLSATHYVVLRTVRLSPPALPTPQGVSAAVSVLSPTSQIGVTVVLANQGSSDEPHVSVRFSLADQTTGATTTQARGTSLALGASVTLPVVTMPREVVHRLCAHGPGDPPARPDPHGRHRRPAATAGRSRNLSVGPRSSAARSACRPHLLLVLGSGRTEFRDWRALHVAESITITDNRNGESIEIPLVNGGVAAEDWAKLLPGVWFFDPGFMSTAACESAVTYLDGDAGILRYRGYPIEQLAENSTYLEVAYLLLKGELPNEEQFADWRHDVTYHTFIHENVRKRFLEGFHYDAHPMGMLVSAVAALSTFYLDAKDIFDPESRNKQIIRLIAKMPTLAAAAHRFSVGMPFVYPDNSLDFVPNFLSMLWKVAEPRFEADPVLARALDILFILHADHEQNCSTTAMRVVGSSHSDPYSATAAAAAALYGPRHGGANEAVIRMLTDIGSIENVPDFIATVKAGTGGQRLQGFGHRVYKSYDPRATIIKRTADEVFEVTGKSPLLDIALKLEEIALNDEYFTSRRLYPNVDFYSGLIYQAMGFPLEMFPVLFAIPRTAGWLAHWQEMLDQDSKISRPRQLYIGSEAARLHPDAATLNQRARPVRKRTNPS